MEKVTVPQEPANTEKSPELQIDTLVESESLPPEQLSDNSLKGMKVSEHETYRKFFKMLQVGVPAQAIKMKMQVEGLDPTMLE